MLQPFTIRAEKEIFNAEGRVIVVACDLVTSEGKHVTWHIVKVPDVVVVFPLTDDGRVNLQKQWRPNRKDFLWGLPSGVIDADDVSPEVAAQRELQEETGVKAGELTSLLTVYPTNHIRAQFHIYLAEHLTPASLDNDEHEHLEVASFPFLEAYEKVVRQQTPTMQDALAFSLVSELRKRS